MPGERIAVFDNVEMSDALNASLLSLGLLVGMLILLISPDERFRIAMARQYRRQENHAPSRTQENGIGLVLKYYR